MDEVLTEQAGALDRALALAERGRGSVSPNPMVGAVVVAGDRVIGEGHHAELGGPHAERAALEDCRRRGADPAGATMFVTLEPCAHHGRQPPCADTIAEAGISRVVIASDDPSEKASGRGPGILRDHGVEVVFAAGEQAAAARLLNQAFRKHARTGRPLVTLKLAMSLDGKVADATGGSRWISGEESRALVHRWRAQADAVAVGIGTADADDPLLSARQPGARRQPLRVVFDSSARLSPGSRLLAGPDGGPVCVVTAPGADPGRVEALRAAGAEVLVAAGDGYAARVTAALGELGRRPVGELMLEGGPVLAGAFADAGEVDQVRLFVAPILIGAGRSAIEGGAALPVAEAARALATESERVGDDVLVSARIREW
ncbi:MAG: bifunctional diaminohydroxyphosphoribosylaminopyrimidine deaminase/5-amino-6-(5-phosphoribosylamino)uracil reductase RibD [Solirubrobacterales bacterium]